MALLCDGAPAMAGVRLPLSAALLALAAPAFAQIHPECKGTKVPGDYNEGVQADFLQNYVALATTFSAVHGPIPHEPKHAAVGLDIGIIPPVGCEKRLVLNGTKTEDPNKTPIVPKPRITVALPQIGPIIPYVGLAWVPPIKMFGTTNVIGSVEVGLGVPLGETVQLGGRFHATSQKTVGEVAEPFAKGDPPVDDLFIASTFGVDLMAGFDLGVVTPYAAFGLVDASTFFYVGDDGYVANNYHPYFGPNFALGVDGLVVERFRFGAEFYGAPGGYSLPDDSVETVKGAARYGHIYTGRFRFAVEL